LRRIESRRDNGSWLRGVATSRGRKREEMEVVSSSSLSPSLLVLLQPKTKQILSIHLQRVGG